MQVAKWGNSLAVRLPAAAAQVTNLKVGDEVDVMPISGDCLEVRRRMSREEALQTLAELSRPLPPGFKFNREKANERPWVKRLEGEMRRQALDEVDALSTPLPSGFRWSRSEAYER